MISIANAVITGDIVNSTQLKGDYKAVLHQIADDIQDNCNDRFIIDIYRGDSFQALTNKPELGLLLMLLIRAGLRRYTDKNKSEPWDSRLALGIGALENYPSQGPLGEFSGDPFIRSGRTLDDLKYHNDYRMAISTGIEALDEEFAAVFPMLDVIVSGWITTQAEAIYLYLLQDLTQKDLGKKLGITQRAAGKRLESSNIYEIQHYEKRYQQLIKTNFS